MQEKESTAHGPSTRLGSTLDIGHFAKALNMEGHASSWPHRIFGRDGAHPST